MRYFVSRFVSRQDDFGDGIDNVRYAVIRGEANKFFQGGETLRIRQVKVGQEFAGRKRITRKQRVNAQHNRDVALAKSFYRSGSFGDRRCAGVVEGGAILIPKDE